MTDYFFADFENVKKEYRNPNMKDFLDCGDDVSEACFKKAWLISKISGNDPVLITGPNGTGKEGYANLVWNEWKDGKIVPREMEKLNCGAISKELIASELFGHKKGAFTGADKDRKGRIRDAAEGKHCLFLDEIGELPMDVQSGFLRLLQNNEIQSVGADECENFGEDGQSLKLIFATNKDLKKEVEKGNFRLDLLNRIEKFHIEVPPLCKRPNDCAVNFKNFFDSFKKKQKKRNGGVEPLWVESLHIDKKSFDAKNREKGYPWPGNFRELQNRLNEAIVQKLLKQDTTPITFDDLFPETYEAALMEAKRLMQNESDNAWGLPNLDMPIPEGFDLEKSLDEIRQKYITHALEQKGENKTQAAQLLGYESYQKMDRRMQQKE